MTNKQTDALANFLAHLSQNKQGDATATTTSKQQSEVYAKLKALLSQIQKGDTNTTPTLHQQTDGFAKLWDLFSQNQQGDSTTTDTSNQQKDALAKFMALLSQNLKDDTTTNTMSNQQTDALAKLLALLSQESLIDATATGTSNQQSNILAKLEAQLSQNNQAHTNITIPQRETDFHVNFMAQLFQNQHEYPFTKTIDAIQTVFSDLNRAMSLIHFLTSTRDAQHSRIRETLGASPALDQLLSQQPAMLIGPIIRFVAFKKNKTDSQWQELLTNLRSNDSNKAYGSLIKIIVQENQRQQLLDYQVKSMASQIQRLLADKGCSVGFSEIKYG